MGALTLDPGSQFLVEINGTTPGTNYDQIHVLGGAVIIRGRKLVITVGAPLLLGDEFKILANDDGTHLVNGTFA